MRSTSIYLFYNDDSVAVGSICINLDITQLIATQNMIDTLIRASEDDISKQMASREIVTNDGSENLTLGVVTPPVGVCLYVGAGIGKISIERVVKAIFPFLIIEFICILIVTYFPLVSTFIPSLAGLA